ncbi:MAG: aminotransferase class III-fold pyridoxal phosphate-dependent enzyme [Aigarchaeota archaeon]|nr:aminotransferase class III-fold pyridoxal phosphate-dependent enzyme [Aigarchaeota archaeon]
MQDDVVSVTRAHLFGTWRKQRGWTPLNAVKGEGCYVLDASGRSILDFSSMLVCVNLGYSNRAIAEAVASQIGTLPYVIPSMTTVVKAEVARLLKEVLPEGLEKFFFSTSGTDAVEAAIKIARLKTGRPKILSRYFSYHGSTSGSIAASGEVRRWFVEHFGKAGDVVFAPPPYCYRCPFKLKYPECGIACVEVIDHIIKNEFGIAGIIFEPVVGTNGVIVPPEGYMERLQEIARENDVLLIDDEVMTGWFRTGKWFAVEHWGVKPDILVTAKGLTSAYVPLALTAVSREIAEHFEDNFFAHGHTYEAHPVGLAAAKAAIQEYRRLRIWENVERVGRYLGRRLRELEERHLKALEEASSRIERAFSDLDRRFRVREARLMRLSRLEESKREELARLEVERSVLMSYNEQFTRLVEEIKRLEARKEALEWEIKRLEANRKYYLEVDESSAEEDPMGERR